MQDAPSDSGRRRGLLDQFLSRSALLVAIYLFLNTTFQQAYLGYLGLHVGLWSIASSLPLLSDFMVGFFAFALWAVLTRIPDTWFNMLAELANPATWRERETQYYRMMSGALITAIFVVSNGLYMRARQGAFQFNPAILLPTPEFFSWLGTLIIYGILSGIGCVGILYYLKLRHQGHRQFNPVIRRRMRILINIVLPSTFIIGSMTIFVVLPSTYGVFLAKRDINRMLQNDYQKVESLVFVAPVCDLAMEYTDSYYIWKPQGKKYSIQYLGELSDMHLFSLVDTSLSTNRSKPIVFRPCMVNSRNVISVQLPDGKIPHIVSAP